MSEVELYKDVKNSLGEGITWSSIDQSLLWVDIKPKSVLFKINLDNEKLETFDLPEFVTAMSIISKNEIALVSNSGVNKFNFQSKKYERIINVEDDILTNRSNEVHLMLGAGSGLALCKIILIKMVVQNL